jgi:CheY-like chemotaxis protein/PAS domain-containing protein
MAASFRALIIDDDRDLLSLIRLTLEFTAGWAVQTALSGAAGIELARAAPPDVILVDVMMPEMDGYEVCRRLKADSATAAVPVVLPTARRTRTSRLLAGRVPRASPCPPFSPGPRAPGPRAVPMNARSCRGRAEFAAGLSKRRRDARGSSGCALSFHPDADGCIGRHPHRVRRGSQPSSHVAPPSGRLGRWLARGGSVPEEWRVATAAIRELDAAAREYRATAPSGVLRSPAARLAVVGELTSLIHAAVDMRELFQGAILKVQRVLEFRRASVVLIDDTATHYYVHTLYDRDRGGFVTREAVFPIEQGIPGQAIRSGHPIRVDALPGTEGILLQEGKHVSAMIVPLHVGDRVIGALNFGHEDPGRYSEEDLDWAVVLGRQIETSLYYSKLLSTITEQREALAREHVEVQSQRNRLEALIDASDAAIMLVGPDRRIAHANAEMAQLVGIPREAMRGASLDSIHRFLGGSFVDPKALAIQEAALAVDASLRDRVELTPQRAV